jgi:uncharacterized membrane protein
MMENTTVQCRSFTDELQPSFVEGPILFLSVLLMLYSIFNGVIRFVTINIIALSGIPIFFPI